MSVDPEKVEAIRAWEAPTNVKGVRSFLGFANFYRDFIEDFSELSGPLTQLTQKGALWEWKKGEQKAFHKLKERFITGPILAYWDPDKLTVLEANCLKYCMGACFF